MSQDKEFEAAIRFELFALCPSGALKCWMAGGRQSHGPHQRRVERKAAKAAIDVLLKATPKSAVLATLNKAKNAAILNLSSGGALNEARTKVGIALSNIIHDHGPPTPQSIDKAKRAIETWIRELEASPAA